MRIKTIKQAYEVPETSVDVIEMEECFLQSNLRDMGKNEIYEEDFDE